MNEFYYRNKSRIDRAFTVVIFVAAIYLFIAYVFAYVAPFCIAFLFSLLIEPLVRLLTGRLRLGRGVSALLCILLTLFCVSVVGTNLLTKVWREAYAFSVTLPSYVSDFTVTVEEIKVGLSDVTAFVPEEIRTLFDTSGPKLLSEATSLFGSFVKTNSVDFVSKVPNFFMNVLIFIISSFFFIKDKPYISGVMQRVCPPALVKYYGILKKGLFTALGGYIKAQSIIMCIIAIINITALMFLSYPYALFLGLIIAVVDALPLFGSGFILWPWAVITLINGNYRFAVALLIMYGVNLLARQFLEPKVLSSQIGLYPLVTLMSIYAGLKIFGVVGVFIGPIIAVSAKVLLSSDTKTV